MSAPFKVAVICFVLWFVLRQLAHAALRPPDIAVELAVALGIASSVAFVLALVTGLWGVVIL